MSDQTINPVFAPTITNVFYSLDYIIFKEKINNGMLCQVNTVSSFGGWDGMGWGICREKAQLRKENLYSKGPEIMMTL